MPADLGILEGTRPDRHEQFRQHYPEGYSMEFVGIDKVESHSGLLAAFKLNQAKRGDVGAEVVCHVLNTLCLLDDAQKQVRAAKIELKGGE